MSKLLDGKILAQHLKDSLRQDVERLKQAHGSGPRLVSILVGEDPAAVAYANSQKRVAEQMDIAYNLVILPTTISQKDYIAQVQKLNQDAGISGIMLFKPLPEQLNYQALANAIDVAKDVEGVNIANIGNLLMGQFNVVPCTPAAAMELLKSSGVSLSGKEAVIVGRSEIVGKPMALLLLKENATVTVCHSRTVNLQEHVSRADIVVAAVGQAGFVKGAWIKPGAVVIDVGINKAGDKIVGDVEFEEAAKRAAFITPVPGGVGPVTVVMLMKNAVEAFKLQKIKV